MYFLIYLFFLHFLSDFILQSRKMGQKKSSSPVWLLKHISIIFVTFVIGVMIYWNYNNDVVPSENWDDNLFFLLTPLDIMKMSFKNAGIHLIIDATLWNIYGLLLVWRTGQSRDFLRNNYNFMGDKWFFYTIGFDQFLHLATLACVYEGLY